jgi:ATP-binding cassette subfamily F protein 3
LLLDEPTNHLDLDTTTWLQEWLHDANETVIVVSHDRAFMDAICTHILHVEARTSEWYKGNYSQFVPQRAERRLSRERELEKQRAYVKKEESTFGGKSQASTRFRQKASASDWSACRVLAPPPGDPAAMDLRFEVAERGGDQVLAVKDLQVEVPGPCPCRRFHGRVATERLRRAHRTERGGQVVLHLHHHWRSRAGSGRGEDRRISDTRVVSPGPRRSSARKSLYDAIQDQRPLWSRGQIQNCLGAFGFSGDEVQREIGTLSGGERARVALALMTLAHANLLILDEPTNHLDVENIEALEDALENTKARCYS